MAGFRLFANLMLLLLLRVTQLIKTKPQSWIYAMLVFSIMEAFHKLLNRHSAIPLDSFLVCL